MLRIDRQFGYRHKLPCRTDAVCRIRIYVSEHWTAVIATELDVNEGPSITNSIEDLAAAVADHFCLDAKRLMLIEHYRRHSTTVSAMDDYHHLVEFAGPGFSGPKWTRLTAAELEAITGEKR